MNISIALKLWGNPTSGSKDACICSFGWVFYCKIEEIRRSGQRAGNDGEKIYIHSRRYLRAFFFFWFGFPQPPGGVMTRRTVFTRQIITVVSVFARSNWLLYP